MHDLRDMLPALDLVLNSLRHLVQARPGQARMWMSRGPRKVSMICSAVCRESGTAALAVTKTTHLTPCLFFFRLIGSCSVKSVLSRARHGR